MSNLRKKSKTIDPLSRIEWVDLLRSLFCHFITENRFSYNRKITMRLGVYRPSCVLGHPLDLAMLDEGCVSFLVLIFSVVKALCLLDHLILTIFGYDARSGICVPKDNTNMKLDFKSLNFNEYTLLINGIVISIS